jgi:hypothetical protein
MFQLFRGLAVITQSQADITTSTASFGSTWRLKTGIRYEARGGVRLSASVIARRGYSLPAAMAQPIGGDAQMIDNRNSSLEFGWAPVQWDTELRIRKMLKTSGRVDVAVVGEALNLLKMNGSDPTPRAPALTSRTVRVGVVLGF